MSSLRPALISNWLSRLVLALFCLAGMGALQLHAAEKLNVLVVTGGHGFNREPFFRMFLDNPDLTFTEVKHTRDADAYDRTDPTGFDVVVLYDMPKSITESQKARFMSIFEKGAGLVVLHHALVSYQNWADYERIIGGRYPEEDGKGGVVTEAVGWEHDVDVPVQIVAKGHPVTAGLADFTIHDEIYWGFRVGRDVTPLLTTTHPKSGKPLAWTRTEGKSRVAFVQLGHGPEAFQDANYRRLLAQSIRWVSRVDDGDWKALFDGKTLEGWVQRGGKAEYRVENGEIVGAAVPGTPNSFLCTVRDYQDFELELEFKVDAGLNSGVHVRSHSLDTSTEFEWKGKQIRVPAKRVHGLQVEIDPSARAWTAGIYEEAARGWLNDLRNNEPARKAFKSGDWNTMRVECRGESVKTWLNGVPAADLKDGRSLSGFIALQVHGVGRNAKPLEVRFRKIRVKEL